MEKHVISQEALIAAGNYVKEGDYWLEKLSRARELTKSYFPYDYNREAKSKFFDLSTKSPVKTRFTGKLFTRLMELSNGFDYTLHMIAVAVTAALLDKYTYASNKDIIVGAPIYKKKGNNAGSEFINTVLALRARLEDNMTFKELLYQVRKTILEANEHKNYPIEVLVSQLDMTISEDDFPLFDVAVLLENIHDLNYLQPVNLNMIFSFLRTKESVEMAVHFNPLRYEETTVQRIVERFTVLLRQVLFNVDLRLHNVEILTGEEKEQLLVNFNDTAMEYPRDKTVHQLFAEQAGRTPDSVAVVGKQWHPRPTKRQLAFGKEEGNGEPVQLTYRELNKRSNQLAHYLRQRGVQPDKTPVAALMVEPSIEMIIGIMGILKAGGAYLPIDPDYPRERIDYMLKDSKAKILLAAPAAQVKVEVKDKKESIEVIDISKELSSSTLTSTCKVRSANLAYIIYTSGTTGRPKGVLVEHRQVVNTLIFRRDQYQLQPGDAAMQLFSYAFDGFVTSCFTPLISGAFVVLPGKEEIKEVEKLRETIVRNKVNHFIAVPPLYRLIIESLSPEETQSLRIVTLAGDVVSSDILDMTAQKNQDIEITNEYGVTEAAVMSTLYRNQEGNNGISIGKPITNTNIYIMDQWNRLQPIGVNGELVIGGAGVSRGYLNQPDLTAEKFDHDLWDFQDYQDSVSSVLSVAKNKIYKTGDLARWRADGNIEFLGRIDHQVKIRGYRIELSEVEYQLRTHQSVKEAVVIARTGKGEDKFLCAYLVPVSGEVVDMGALKQHLFARLPVYMVPQYMVQLEQIPLTPNGKIDRKTLAEPEENSRGLETHYVEPETDEEKIIADIWKEVLSLEKVGIHDNFFDLGGNSLGIIKITRRLREIFKQDVQTAVIFLNPTINLLVRYFSSKATGEESLQDQEEVDRSEVIGEGRSRLRRRLQRMEVGN